MAATGLRVMTVLSPRERFAPGECGAIGLLVRRLAGPGEVVVGTAPQHASFAGVAFRPVPPVFSWRGGRVRYRKGVARLIRENRPDLVEVHNRPDLALALRRCFPSLPVVLVLHNDPCSMRRARRPAEREYLARAVAVVAVSEWVRQRFVSQGVGGCVSILPNSLDLEALPAPLPPEQRENLLLFAGRVVADKGVDAFVAACAELLPRYPGWQAQIFGADDFGEQTRETPFLRALRPQAHAAGVELVGYRPHEAVLDAMSRAAIVAAPSRWGEPFGMAALEALGCGAAVLVSPNGNLPELAGQAAVYADPDSLPELVAGLESLMTDASLRARLGQAGQSRAARFDCRTMRAIRAELHAEVVRAWPGKGLFSA
ncbi:glycosyltransferase family 4 protein [Acetobacter suratthaniensis]|uniref:Glycosyltransferase family 4 protein n=2 Tax=Acetobacter suratthaniensis TaxID=1502841 RepID=A0ABS3LMW7_9PROT|nr:glycosyltransferase family 4 protein [Acetobacter suratthaniensis]